MSKVYFASQTDLSSVETPYATCSTAAETAAKIVSKSGFTLKTGAMIAVKFTYANTAANPTLNVNSTGAKPIYSKGGTTISIVAGGVYFFTYDGSCWQLTET